MTAIVACQYCKKVTGCSCPGELLPATRAELEEAIRNLAQTSRRLPAHFVDKRAAIHDRINELLTLRELTE